MMSALNPSHAVLLLLLIFSVKLKTTISCQEIEKQSLLKLKQSFEDPNNTLSSWESDENCCKWKGVVCNNLTGHVHQLRLQEHLGGKIDPSLVNLKHLRYLDLSQNYFEGTIPSFIGSFTNLEYLNLSFAGFHGKIPHTLGNLSKLHTLDLAVDVYDPITLSLNVDRVEWLSGLPKLEYLNMNGADMSRATKWAQVINILPSLLQLHFQLCSLEYVASLDDLINITSLRFLDLSLNWFEGTIPSFIGSFTNLEYLNLSRAGFHGKIPHTLGNLSHLHTLDLGTYGCDGPFHPINLHVDRVEWLSGLPKLEYLNMNCANMSRATKWAQVINTLPSLLQLHFQSCSLEFKASLDDVINITSLRSLDLSLNYNQFTSPAPAWIFQLINLVSLDLCGNNLLGPIPSISNATKLQYIDLSSNFFNYSSIPDWLFSCRDLQFLYLGGNREMNTRTIPKGIGNLTSLNVLDLRYSRFSGKIPGDIFKLCKLKQLEFSMNELQGEISELFGNMSECFSQYLEILSLERNKFTGNIPVNFGQLSNLYHLSIEHNMLEGVVSEAHFANLTKLETFDANGNHLTLKVGANWIPPFQLDYLGLGSWNLGPSSQILSWLETQKKLSRLDLSNAGISGNIPLWISDSRFVYVNMSHNNLHGNIPQIGAWCTYLSSNKFSGALPLLTGSIRELDLSDNSFSRGLSHFLCNNTSPTNESTFLHLGGNELGGELPDCWMKWPSLKYLNLGNNNMHGSIPTSFGYLQDLWSLNLYGNKFTGQLPFSMHNCTKVIMIDLSNNRLNGSIPTWMGANLVELRFLILRSNKLSGEIPLEICYLNYLQILDFSHNTISGIIPSCVDNLTAMATKKSLDNVLGYSTWKGNLRESASIATKGRELLYDTILDLVTSFDLSRNNLSGEIPKELMSLVELRTLNLSQNHLRGSIPEKIGDMKQLESLDLSRNSLSGQIPNSITLISSLSYLNLSYNNFTGKIPQGTQLQGFDASSFFGNNLCGPPLSNCSHDSDQVSGHKDEDDESHEIEWLYVFISTGYAVGVSIVVSVLALNKSWREAYFGGLASMWDKLYVFVLVNWRRLTKLLSTSS